MSISDNIRLKRAEKKMTLEELARRIGTSKQTIQRYETGVISNIPSDKVEALAVALETTPAFLMGWDDGIYSISKKESFSVSPHEKRLLLAYRAKPELQAAVDKLLDIEAEVVNAPSRTGTA